MLQVLPDLSFVLRTSDLFLLSNAFTMTVIAINNPNTNLTFKYHFRLYVFPFKILKMIVEPCIVVFFSRGIILELNFPGHQTKLLLKAFRNLKAQLSCMLRRNSDYPFCWIFELFEQNFYKISLSSVSLLS